MITGFPRRKPVIHFLHTLFYIPLPSGNKSIIMQMVSQQLETIIDQHRNAIKSLSPAMLLFKPSPVKWSKKEIIGHLVDSAHNNIRRFVVAQYEDTPHIVYNQDKWVSINGYQEWDFNQLVELWYLLNKQLCRIWENMEPGMNERNCMTQALHNLEWLAHDYIKHLLHHMHQVLELDPVTYP